MHISITTELLGEHPPLLDIEIPEIGDDALTSWVRGGDGLIGFGIYASKIVKGANRFEQARQWWREQVHGLDIHNNVHGTGTGPILFTSFAFDEAEDSVLIIPKVVVGQRNGKSWITWIGATPQPALHKASRTAAPLNISWSGSNGDVWQDRVARSVEKIKNESLEKVVLARFITGNTTEKINQRNLLHQLAIEYPSTWVYSCLLYTSPSPRDGLLSRMPSSA